MVRPPVDQKKGSCGWARCHLFSWWQFLKKELLLVAWLLLMKCDYDGNYFQTYWLIIILISLSWQFQRCTSCEKCLVILIYFHTAKPFA